MIEAPRLLLAAPASGCGKTTVTCALLQVWKNRGLAPMAFKSGPDYLDPMFHTTALGVPSRNLDLFLMGEEAVRRSLAIHAAGHGLSLLEGAMGYYDGISLSSRASAWDLARTTQTPAVLVVDGRGAARSVAAVVKGFQVLEEEDRLRGVLLNRVSPMLYPRLKACIEGETGLTVYGFLPKLPDCTLESRHLGLVSAGEVVGLQEKLRKLAAQAEQTVDLDGLLSLARTAPALETPQPRPGAAGGERPVIAVARDDAFCFYYADALALLEELGAEFAFFSPLRDEALPEGTCGLYLGGGYPELHARTLAENHALLREIHEKVLDGLPTVAECGGFLYLQRTLTDGDGRYDWRMAGVVSGEARNTGTLGRFGYVTLTARKDGLLCRAGEALPAHEFHYWDSTTPGRDFRAQKPLSERGWDCAFHTPTLYAGFPHLHFCGCPEAAARFVAACGTYKREEEGSL